MKNKKSLFISKQIRKLTRTENKYVINILEIIQNKVDKNTIAYVPDYVSYDKKVRPLILDKGILIKIENKHGKIPIENLLINAHDFDYAIVGFDNVEDKINLIKLIPNSNNFLLISAIKINGYFLLTHFETETLQGNELKSLLGRGELVSSDARPGSDILSIKAIKPIKGGI
jgi:hypothetical protein